MCFVKSKYEKKQLFIHNKYLVVLYRSFFNTYIYIYIYYKTVSFTNKVLDIIYNRAI